MIRATYRMDSRSGDLAVTHEASVETDQTPLKESVEALLVECGKAVYAMTVEVKLDEGKKGEEGR